MTVKITFTRCDKYVPVHVTIHTEKKDTERGKEGAPTAESGGAGEGDVGPNDRTSKQRIMRLPIMFLEFLLRLKPSDSTTRHVPYTFCCVRFSLA